METVQTPKGQFATLHTTLESLTSHSSAEPSTPSFLRLSPELRNQIYQHIYASSAVRIGTEVPGLLLTCKQIQNECIELFYAVSAFYVEDWDTLLKWLKNLPERNRALMLEIWCGYNMALPDAPKENVMRHGVLKRMGLRLKNLGLALSGPDVLRSELFLDGAFSMWSSDPVLAWEVAEKALEDWQCKRKPKKFRHLPKADAIRLRIMERLHELSEGQAQHTIAPRFRIRADRLRYRFLRL